MENFASSAAQKRRHNIQQMINFLLAFTKIVSQNCVWSVEMKLTSSAGQAVLSAARRSPLNQKLSNGLP